MNIKHPPESICRGGSHIICSFPVLSLVLFPQKAPPVIDVYILYF